MVDNATIFENNPDASTCARRELLRLVPLIVNFLNNNQGFDVSKAAAEFEKHRKEYYQKKAELEKKRESELKEAEATAEQESYRLLFANFQPVVNGELVNWNFKFKTNEYETVSLEQCVQEKHHVFVSHVALTDPKKYLNELEKDIANVEFMIRRKDSGAIYDSPVFRVKRVR